MSETFSFSTLDQIPKSAATFGVIGHPVAHSLSPELHGAAFGHWGMQAAYHKIDLLDEELAAAVAIMKSLPFAGWNVTIPHKFRMAGLVDQKADSAAALGGVNTVLNENGRLIGFNTDGLGWVRAIREEFSLDVRDLRIMILGAGGAGQALAKQAALEHCERLVLVNRSQEKAAALEKELTPFFRSEKLLGADTRLKSIPWDEPVIARELNTIDLLVNATSLGLKNYDPAVLPGRILQPHLCVYDTIYKPAKTKFLVAGQEAGARCANGLSMLLHQGALSLEIWTGRTAPIAIMRQTLREKNL